MTNWTSDELTRIGQAEELKIAARRRDGTLRDPVIIWVVRDGDDLYIRSVNGPTAAWFRGTQARHEGRVWAGGVEKEVTFAETDSDIEDRLDAAYQTKYASHAQDVIDSINSPKARSTTLRLLPRAPDASP
jgi:hypothetical protein